MTAVSSITPLILTYNEEPNLRRCLERLRWAGEVVIIDSGSTDATAQIAAEFSNVRLLVRPFDDHTSQWNYGVDAVQSLWVLSLDADYVLGAGFEDEIIRSTESTTHDAFFASFRYLIGGRPLRACLYPPRAVLFRKDHCRYRKDGHTQLLHVPGASGTLVSKIDHDDRKPLSRWFASQDKYAALEADKLLSLPPDELHLQDRIRRAILPGPWLVFIYTLLVRGTLLDGWRGWFYAFQRMVAEIMLSLRLLERRILSSDKASS
ncbi:glycosyltransferase family 2 protein [Prosthecobacter sp.]|uniref:glycosyltransferase family 2 protein n=1 Tax=Prosthecobacter sp. TaxID=1965333 RepID=UPI001D64434F|nr:glycosyltransferase family 2 protein [Prosthecobacter sp.]MCB1275581.1 glycosyltransferase family 2 protein [Prosthecobacter sp.]